MRDRNYVRSAKLFAAKFLATHFFRAKIKLRNHDEKSATLT
jgi:hypothetical protein